MLHMSTEAGELGEEIYNSSAFFLDYIIPDLIPGTTYYITLTVSIDNGEFTKNHIF